MARPRREIDLPKVFLAPRVLTIEQLARRIDASRSTILRRLREYGYYSSYNHGGRFLTIADVAEFDARGLWCFKTARFSRQGKLTETIELLVRSSDAGMNHSELAALLAVRVHNQLLGLVEACRVVRERIGGSYVYLSAKTAERKRQQRRRLALVKEAEKPRPSSRQIIATLLELVADPRATQGQIVTRCQKAGIPISAETVAVVFERYDLDKKRAP